MPKKESEKILEDVLRAEKDIHFYKTEINFFGRPKEHVVEVRKLVVKAEDRNRHLKFELQKAEHRESVIEKKKIKEEEK